MKTILLTNDNSYKILEHYGGDLLEELQESSEFQVYKNYKSDFSDVIELSDDSEKLVLFDPYTVEGGFHSLNKALLNSKNIKFLLIPYSSIEGVDYALLANLGIRYSSNAGANSKAVAQFAIMAMFMLLRRYPILGTKSTIPDGSILGEEIESKTAGIIGMGMVGLEIHKYLKALGIKTVYVNRTDQHLDISKVEFEKIFDQDIIFISIAVNDDTKRMMKSLPEYLKKNHYVIDTTAQEGLYEIHKVIELLDNDKISGYSIELLNSSLSIQQGDKNLLVTPHMAWCTVEEENAMVRSFLNKALKIVNNRIDEVDFTE